MAEFIVAIELGSSKIIGIAIAEMYLAPLALADGVLSEAEKEEEDALLKKAQSEQVEGVQRTEEEERDKARKEVKRQEDASAGLTE